jgi:hypothetical protein
MSTTPLPSLVGDVILGGRELFTDLPPTYGPPTLLSATPAIDANGNFPNGVAVTVRATFLTKWGETLGSVAELTTAALSGGQNAVDCVVGPIPLEAAACRIYFSTAGIGTESLMQQFNNMIPSVVSQTFRITYSLTINPTVSQSLPSRSTAYLPDMDGPAVGASSVYRWLNQALAWAAAKNRGGLPDFGGAGTTNAQPNYVLPGYWRKIDSAWFDGYPLGLLYKNNVFRRNPVPGFSGMLVVFQATDRLMVEAWPQPNRTSNQTTLSAPMLVTDTTATLTSVVAQVLGFGLYQIGSEIVNYAAVTSNSLTGLQRGMCGTTPVAHSIGEACVELNLMIAGYRVPSKYNVGQSGSTFFLPPGWDEALTFYLLYRFRKAEQDEPGAAAAYKEATEKISAQGANRIIAGPRQISPFSAIGPEVGAGLGTAFGGVIIP